MGSRATGTAGSQPYGNQGPSLTLGVAPVSFSAAGVRIGRIAPETREHLRDLRREHGRTHAFRFDSRSGMIVNVGVKPDTEPMGDVEEVDVSEHLLLLAEAIGNQLRHWVSGRRKILRQFRPMVCLGSHDRLLTKAARDVGVQAPDPRLDVVAKWSFDLRLLFSPDANEPPYLGLLVDVGTSNMIDLPAAELLALKLDLVGRYIGAQEEEDDGDGMARIRLLGRVTRVVDKTLFIDDVRDGSDITQVDAADVMVEPRHETLEAVTHALYPSKADQALSKLRQLRGPYLSGKGKLHSIKQMVDGLNGSARAESAGSLNLRFGGGLSVEFGSLLDQSNPRFPRLIGTSRPPMLFGASGYNQHNQPDYGIRQHGPFQYSHNMINDPTVVVVCNRTVRGRMDQFAKHLRDGIGGNNDLFANGIVGKFRLTNMRFHFVEVNEDTGQGYADAVRRSLEELPQVPALALVQVREAHKQIVASDNPYYVAKGHFMRAGVPVQAVRLETIDNSRGRVYSLNNLALAAYAKIGGIPWVISAPGVATHELVIGIGSTEVGGRRLGGRTRYVGITTLFQGDGRYLVWETTREATFENYPQALLDSLRTSIRFVRAQNKWESGDNVRLVFHVYKPLKRVEIRTVKELVEELLGEYAIEFSFLDVSHYHPYQVFDLGQRGVTYRSYESRRTGRKGVYVPIRGTAMLLGPNTALLQLVGPREVKTWAQGMPRPLLLELHRDSDFADLTYLVRQAFHFSFMSWRSFFPSDEPVTILYSRWIANMLGNLRAVPDWDGSGLRHMRDRRAMWFL
ncbi:MAG: Piwi domain-containing protein [Gammaproteobacteria bacterium]|nr:Piwi domain-containing protein [Gammaproteobacteria bacterium]